MSEPRPTAPIQDDPDKTAFIEAVRQSLAADAFLKLTLGKYHGSGEAARCTVSRVLLKGVAHLRLVTRAGTQETTQNYLPEAGLARLAELIGRDYLSATLFTAHEDVSLLYSRKRVPRLSRIKPTLSEAPSAEHNRTKAYLVDPAAPYLAHLGVTHAGDAGRPPQVKPSMYAKFRQICRFVEILDQVLAGSKLKDVATPRIVDIGSGKGYLTFALHEHLVHARGKQPETLGLETNAGLVDQCAAVAAACGIEGLSFEATRAEVWAQVRAEDAGPGRLDILIALHACDTATDDAIHLGITGNAQLIVCAPCCQHELAPQLGLQASPIDGLLKYGLFKQRQADLFTDAARALLLEAHGYHVRIIEFVSTEHSGKNLMIAAVRSDDVDRKAAATEYERLAAFAGYQHHKLSLLLSQSNDHAQS